MTHPPFQPNPPRHKRPVLLDLPLDELMVIMARVVDTSVAQLANFFIAYGAVTYLTEESFRMEVEKHRTRSRTIKFLWNLQLPEHWLNLIQEALPEEENEEENDEQQA